MKAKPFCEKHQCDKRMYMTARKKPDGTMKKGVQYVCMKCRDEKYANRTMKQKEVQAAQWKARYEANKEELNAQSKQRYEALWEMPDNLTPEGKVWMSWDNWGIYNAATWLDNDYSTHTWNGDHIRPQSEFSHTDPNDPEFQACWAVDNMRPLSAKLNVLEGNKRSRQTIDDIMKRIAEFLANRGSK